MTVIQLPDEQAAALRAKAAEQGLTLEDWLGRLAAAETTSAGARHRTKGYKLDELVAQCDLSAAQSPDDRAWLDAPPVGREAL